MCNCVIEELLLTHCKVSIWQWSSGLMRPMMHGRIVTLWRTSCVHTVVIVVVAALLLLLVVGSRAVGLVGRRGSVC